MRDLCPKCQRVFRRNDVYEVNDAGYKVHAEGHCRGPRAVHTFMVGYQGDRPVSVARLPVTEGEVASIADGLIGRGFEVRLKRLNARSLERLIKEIQSPMSDLADDHKGF